MFRIVSLLLSVMLLIQANGLNNRKFWQENAITSLTSPANLSTSSNVELLGQYDTPGSAHKLFLQSNNLFMTDAPDWDGSKYVNGGLRIFDVTDPGLLSIKGNFATSDYPHDIWVDGTLGYLTESNSTNILSVADPVNMFEMASIPSPEGSAFSVAKRGNYVYVGYGNGFQVINVSNPDQILQRGIPFSWMVNEIAIQGGYAYLAAWDGGVVVMSLANPVQPVIVGRFQIPSSATYDVAVEGNYAYVAGADAGLYILDISDPANPHDVGHIKFQRNAIGVDVENGIAYVATRGQGLRVINCNIPAHPYEVGFYQTSEPAHDVVVSNNIAYVANGITGLSVFQFTGPVEPINLLGPATGYIGLNYLFAAHFSLPDISEQMSYVWTASDQQPVTHVSTQYDEVSFTWNTPGKKMVTVNVIDSAGNKLAMKSIDITIMDIKEFAVNRLDDADDAIVGDGICQTEMDDCTLRAAIQEANFLADLNLIDIPAGIYYLTIPGADEDSCLSGDLDILNPLMLVGEGADKTIIDGSGLDRVLHLAHGQFSMHGLTIQNGIASNGGCILVGGSSDITSVLLENIQILNNTATGMSGGGGISHFSVPLTIKNSLISGNHATGREIGGGIGSAIYSDGGISAIDEPTLIIDHSSITDNTADSGAAVGVGCNTALIKDSTFENNQGANDTTGGAIYQSCGKMRIIGSTITNNRAGGGAGIGSSGERLEIINSTIAYNTGGAVVATNGHLQNVTVAMNTGSDAALFGILTLSHTLLAFNGPTNCWEDNEFISQGYNLSSDWSCKLFQANDLPGVNPQLDTLGNHGGPTSTFSLKAFSPAIDAGDNTCVESDQRGVKRPLNGNEDEIAACDIGAFEYIKSLIFIPMLKVP